MLIGWLILEGTPDELVHLKTPLSHKPIRKGRLESTKVSVQSLECERTPQRGPDRKWNLKQQLVCVSVCECFKGIFHS